MYIIQDYIATCGCIFFIIAFTSFLLLGLKQKKLLAGYMCFMGLCVIVLFLFFLKSKNRMEQFYYCVEYAHIPLFMYLFWRKREDFIFFYNSTSKGEKIVLSVALLFGLSSILFCAISNIRYIYPCNIKSCIGNYYFNADTEWSITAVFTNTMPNMRHPLYRFIQNIPLLPCVLLFHVLGHTNWFLGGYYIAALQVIWNSISAFLLYRILVEETNSKKISICAVSLYIISTDFIWTAILPETFSLTVCCLLLALYLIQEDSPLACAFIVLAAGLNLFLSIICLPYLIRKANGFFRKRFKGLFLCGIFFILLTAFLGKTLFIQYIDTISMWTIDTGFLSRMYNLWPSIFSSGFLGPHILRVGPYYMQDIYWNVPDVFLFIVIILTVLPLSRKRNSLIIYSALVLIMGGIVLHGIIGFGEDVGFLYSPLYLPAVIILVTVGISRYEKPVFEEGILLILFLFTAVSSAKWLTEMGSELKNTNFPISTWCQPEHIFKLGTMSFCYENGKILMEGHVLLEKIDSIQVSEKENRIVGTTRKGEIYDLTVRGDYWEINYLQ